VCPGTQVVALRNHRFNFTNSNPKEESRRSFSRSKRKKEREKTKTAGRLDKRCGQVSLVSLFSFQSAGCKQNHFSFEDVHPHIAFDCRAFVAHERSQRIGSLDEFGGEMIVDQYL